MYSRRPEGWQSPRLMVLVKMKLCNSQSRKGESAVCTALALPLPHIASVGRCDRGCVAAGAERLFFPLTRPACLAEQWLAMHAPGGPAVMMMMEQAGRSHLSALSTQRQPRRRQAEPDAACCPPLLEQTAGRQAAL